LSKAQQVEAEKISRNVVNIRMNVKGEDWEQWFMLSSDRHFDGVKNNRELQIEHLELARKRHAKILDFGDIFDLMQGKYDPRRSYTDMRPEYLAAMIDKTPYFDVIVKDAAKFYKKYADMFILIARGNHESAAQTHNGTDMIERLVSKMNIDSGVNIFSGAYGGWVRFKCTIGGTQGETINLKYFHGSGGGGPVTKGTIQSNRQAVYLPDAQIVVNGHIHESWILSIPRERISDHGVVSQDMQHHVRTPTYQNDYGDGADGYHVESGRPPKPMGCVWLRLYRERKHMRIELIQDIR